MKGNVLRVTPHKCLQDEKVLVEMHNLPPGADVTLTSRVDDEFTKNIFFTYSHFRANEQGKIDLSKDGSMGGTFRGIFQMGPIGALRAGPETYKYYRYISHDVTVPMTVKFTVLKGHLDEKEAYKPHENLILDSSIHERIFLTEDTKRIPVREGRVRGTLFMPGGDGPFPGVLDIFGGSGSLFEFRAAQFAARGIAALALAFYDFEDIPVDIPELDIEYFHEAARYLLKQDKVKKPNVAVIGLSKGCDLAFSISTFIPEVKAAICINGMSLNLLKPMRLKDKTIPAVQEDPSTSKVKELEPGVTTVESTPIDPASWPECQIPIEQADAQFLLISCKDDKALRADIEHERVASILKSHGKDNYEIVKYEGAGHLLESPYAPHAPSSFHRVFKIVIVWGGNAYEHTHAAEDSWKRSIEFIKKYIK